MSDPSSWSIKINNTEIGVIDNITEELNDQEVATVKLHNDSWNRTLVATDQDVVIKWGNTTIFYGLLKGSAYSSKELKPKIYNKVYSMLAKKQVDTGETVFATVDQAMTAICIAAGITKGSVPTQAISAKFIKANCLDAVIYLAQCCVKDYWSTSGTTINIGDRGSYKGAMTIIGVGDRSTDRQTQHNHVWVKGTDVNGAMIWGEAKSTGWTTGNDTPITKVDSKSKDVATLNNIAASYLKEEELESSGVTVEFQIDEAYNLHPGDTVNCSREDINLSGTYKVWKTVRKYDRVEASVDRMQNQVDKELRKQQNLEDMGIYEVQGGGVTDHGNLTGLGDDDHSQYFNPTRDDISDVPDLSMSAPTIAILAEEIDSATEFRCWLKVTITRVANAGGYIIGYRKNGETTYNTIPVEQTATGDPVVKTPDLAANTPYNVFAATLSQKGTRSAYSNQSTQFTTDTNDTAPSTPGTLVATPLLNGILIEWAHVAANDLLYYQVFRSIDNNPAHAVSVGTARGNCLIWTISDPDTQHAIQYFWVTAIDNVNNESAKQASPVSGTPIQLKSIDLTVEMRKWVSNIEFYYTDANYDFIGWRALGGGNASISWSDGSTSTVNAGTQDAMAVGTWWLYWNNSATLALTQTYSNAVGVGKALLATVVITSGKNPTILPFNGYVPTIGAGYLAVGCLEAVNLRASVAYITNQAQIGNALIYSDHVNSTLGISSAKIIFDGAATFLNSWQKTGDLTKINGGVVSAATIAVGALASAVTDMMFGSSSIKTAIEAWRHASDITLIDGGDIYANSITIAKLASDATNKMFSSDAAQDDIEAWRKSGAVTYIDGNKIYTGSITTDQLTATEWITGKLIRTAATGTRLELSSTELKVYDECVYFYAGNSVFSGFLYGSDGYLNLGSADILNLESIGGIILHSGYGVTTLHGDLVLHDGDITLGSGTGTITISGGLSCAGEVHGGGSSGNAFLVGDDCRLVDIGYANRIGVQGVADVTQGGFRFGSTGPWLYRSSSYLRTDVGFECDGNLAVGILANTTTTGPLYINASHQIGYSGSSIRYKENVEDLPDCSWIYNLRPVSFDWKDEARQKAEGGGIGLIAEEVNVLCPKLVSLDKEGIPDSVHYEWLGIPLLVEMKKLRLQIESLKKAPN